MKSIKLLSCEIENFGKFHRESFAFKDGLCAYCRPNGWGKSTLAAFLKSMFYGLSDNRARAQNDRKKYAPWQGGAFGGALHFEYRGKRYRFERFFGKTPSGDIAKLYDAQTKLPCADFGGDLSSLGEKIFGVDKESFERTLYFPQEHAEWEGLSTDVKGKLLNAFSADADETVERALARLDEAERALVKRAPYKGKLDLIEEGLALIQQQKSHLFTAREHIQKTRAEYAQLQTQLQQTENSLREISSRLSQTAEGETNPQLLRFYAEERAVAEEEYAALSSLFIGNPPTLQEVEDLEKQISRYEEVSAYISALQADETQPQDRQTPTKPPQRTVFAAIFAVLFALFGAGLLAFSLPLSLCLFVGSALSLFVALLQKSKREKTPKNPLQRNPAPAIFENSTQTDGTIEGLKIEKQTLERGIEGAFSNFSFSQFYSYQEGTQFLKSRLTAYRSAIQRLHRLQPLQALHSTLSQTTPTQQSQANTASLKLTKTELENHSRDLSMHALRLRAQIEEEEGKADELSLSLAHEEEILQEKSRLQRKLSAIRLAKQCLKQAQENLLSRYLLPVVEGCGRYLNEVCSPLRVQLDGEGNTYAESDSTYRQTQAFSRGARTLISLCVRLALIDELYGETAPFLLLDDPFVDLDDQTLPAVKSLLKSLSARRQVLYFTCRKEMLP